MTSSATPGALGLLLVRTLLHYPNWPSGVSHSKGPDDALRTAAEPRAPALLKIFDPRSRALSGWAKLPDRPPNDNSGDRERRTPVRRSLSAERNAAVAREAAPHWGAALPSSERAQIRERCCVVVVVVVVIEVIVVPRILSPPGLHPFSDYDDDND